MDFRDELVYAGQYDTDLGYAILGNAARSVHQGLELAARAENGLPRGVRLTLDGNATPSDNHFVSYREIYGTSPGDTAVYDGRAIGFFPAVMGNLSARGGWHRAPLAADVQYVGRMYLDQTESREGSVAPRTVVNLTAGYRLPLARRDPPEQGARPGVEFTMRLLNAFDARMI